MTERGFATPIPVNAGKPWTAREERYLSDNPRLPYSTLAKVLGRTMQSVRWKAYAIGAGRQPIAAPRPAVLATSWNPNIRQRLD